MNIEFLQNIGLNEPEIAIYSSLLQNGEQTPTELAKSSDVKRSNCYHVLGTLVSKGIIEEFHKNKKAHFRALHPESLADYIEKSKQELDTRKNVLTAYQDDLSNHLPHLVSTFSLSNKKPVVTYFEGKEGLRSLAEVSLQAKTEILTVADLEAIDTHIPELNNWYVSERNKLGIKKRGLVLDTDYTRNLLQNYPGDTTDSRLLSPNSRPAFATVIQIHDNKVSFQTLTTEKLVGILIEDQDILNTFTFLFESLWANARTFEK